MLFGTSNPLPEGSEKESLSSWLDRAERETWQMELLLSGFAIVLLAQAKAPLDRWLAVLHLNAGIDDIGEALALAADLLLPNAWLVIISSLVLGVALRALWISSIGLRSVSGDIDLEGLSLAPVFDKFLKRRIPPFDKYIERLENVCSIIFGLTFLAVFSIIGTSLLLVVSMFVLNGVGTLLEALLQDDQKWVFLLFIFGFLMIATVVVSVSAIDFLTGSSLKQFKGFSKFYYPLYRVFGWLTLARLYRPLYYNFIDNKIGRAGVLSMVPYGLFLLVVLQFNNSSFTPQLPRGDNYGFGKEDFYVDTHGGASMSTPMLQAKFIKDGVLNLYVPLGGHYYSATEGHCLDEATDYKRLAYIAQGDTERFSRYSAYADCLAGAYKVLIDDTEQELQRPIILANGANNEPQILFSIRVDELPKGGHLLRLFPNWDTKRPARYAVTIPFITQ